MNMEDMILVSADDHTIEPADMFEGRVASKFQDRAPRVVNFTNGEQRWTFEGRILQTLAASAVAGRKRDELGAEATRFSELRDGIYLPAARVDDMSANGVLSSVCFPTLAGFAGELFFRGEDKECMLAMIQAYNDWHLDVLCAPHPGRFIPLAVLPLWDAKLTVAEIRRVARKGARTVCLPENPAALGLPSIHRDYWNPILEACIEEDIVISIHIGTAGQFPFPSDDTPMDWWNSMINISVAGSVMDWVFSPLLRKYPQAKFSISEGCVGWVPFMMERADDAYRNHRFWTNQNLGDLLPSDIMRRQFIYCFHSDPIGLKNRNDMGVDLIAWECDYPHADSTWPRSPELLWEQIASFPKEDIDKITHKNALRFFSFDPFKHIPREKATVGALRAAAAHVDTTETSLGENGGGRMRVDKDLGVLTARSLKQLSTTLSEGLVPAE